MISAEKTVMNSGAFMLSRVVRLSIGIYGHNHSLQKIEFKGHSKEFKLSQKRRYYTGICKYGCTLIRMHAERVT